MKDSAILEKLKIAASQNIKERDYWREKFSGHLVKSNFPYDYKEGGNSNTSEKTIKVITFQWPGELFLKLIKRSNQSDVRIHMILTAGVVALLGRYTVNSDIVVGMPIYKQDIEGEFINKVLALKNQLRDHHTFRTLLNQVKQTIVEAVAHQDYPIEMLLEDLNMSSRKFQKDFPLFDIAVLLENIHDKTYIREIYPNMIFSFNRCEECIEGAVEYNAQLYSDSTPRRIIAHLQRLLVEALTDLDLKLPEIELLSEKERQQLVYDFNDTAVEFPKDKTIVQLFREQVANTPRHPAVSTYVDLTPIYDELTSDKEKINGHLIAELEKCCFKKNPYVFQFEDKTFLSALNMLGEEEVERLTLVRTHRDNYVAVNQTVLLLLDYLDGKSNLKSLAGAIKNTTLKCWIYPVAIDLETGQLQVKREKIVVNVNGSSGNHVLDDIILLIKALYRSNLIELADYHSRVLPLDIDFPEKKTGFTGEKVKTGSGEDKKSKGSASVLLLGDRAATATTGLLYMAAYLRRNGINACCRWNDLNKTTTMLKEEIEALVTWFQPKVVGVSMKWFPHIARVLEICKIVKNCNPSIKIVVGGNTASYYKEKIIQYECIDLVVAGDGEVPLLKICQGENPENIPNCVYKKNGKIFVNPITYVQNEKNSQEIFLSHMDEIFVSKLDPYLTPSFYINTGKGCSQQCFYCAGCRDVQEKSFNRPKPFIRGVDEVHRDMIEAKPYTSRFMFDFDLPFYNSSDYYKKIWEGIDLSNHFCRFYFWMLPTPEFIDLVVKTFKFVYINIDLCSLSENHRLKLSSLKVVKPQPTDAQLFEFFDRCEKYDNIEIIINHITGLPYFSFQDIEISNDVFSKLCETYSTFKEMDWGRLHAQPGAPIVETCEKYGMHSFAKTFADFLYYSELNLKEEQYPELFTYNYPYIYSDDERLNSKITQYYSQVHEKIQEHKKNRRRNLKVSTTITYEELNEKSNRLARILGGRGVKPGTIVGLWMERSIDMITGLLGILKAGAAYLPINPEYPVERINYMLKDSNARVLLTQPDLHHQLEISDFAGDILDLSEKNLDPGPVNPQQISISPGSPAYVLYTSGSTGRPKGVLVEHGNVIRLIKNSNFIEFEKDDKLLLTGAIAFDITTFEIWGSLLHGITLFLVDQNLIVDARKLKRTLYDNNITILHLIPQLFNQLAAVDPGIFARLKYFLVGGDLVQPYYVNRIRNSNRNLKILHMYGPTENTTFSTSFLVKQDHEISIPIGKPIGNSTVYIVDKFDKTQPIGVVGELYTGGRGVARGYLNRPGLTRDKFVPNPFRPGETIYKTGDFARWLPDGNIEFVGRMDSQVKIRGFRIETEEIENRLLMHDHIKEAVVVAGDDGTGNKYLSAYIVATGTDVKTFDQGPSITELREYLLQTLPDYMVPSYFVHIEAIPLSPNGKIDRRALPEPGVKLTETYIAPRNEVEEKLAEIWSEALGIGKNKISIDNNFFELGGHSLKATFVISKIHQELEINVGLADIFKAPTIKGLAQYIMGSVEDKHHKYTAIKRVEKKEYYRLSSAQKRLYILQQMGVASTAYNMPKAIPLAQAPDMEHLERTFGKLIRRHESLRTSFHMSKDEPVQRVHENVEFEIHKKELSEGTRGLAPLAKESAAALMSSFIRPFDLSQAPLLRVGVVKRRDGSYLLLVDMHHIISDGVSYHRLLEDFMDLGQGTALAPLRIQYKDFSEWQNSEKEKESIKRQAHYWLKEFENQVPVLNLPIDYPRPSIQSFEGDSASFQLSRVESRVLKDMSLKEQSTLYMTVLAVFNVLLSKIANQEDIIVGTPVAGRKHADLHKIIGMFVNTLALRNYPNAEKTFLQFLMELKQRTLAAFENQDYQFEDLVDKVSVNRDAGRNPLFDVLYTIQTIEDNGVERVAKQWHDGENNIMRESKFDMIFYGVESVDSLSFTIEYCTKLLKKETIERFIAYFKKIVSSVIKEPGIKLSQLEVIPDDEKRRLLYGFNKTDTRWPKNKTIHQLFEEQVKRTPGHAAIAGTAQCTGGKTDGVEQHMHITYDELNQKSNQLAHLLKEKGIQPDTIVGIIMERSLEMIIAILAILKAGGAYLPIDPDYPEGRIKFMLADSRPKALVTTRSLAKNGEKRRRYEVETIFSPPIFSSLSPSPLLPSPRSQPSDIAYIIYTSGTTGKPKGVLIQHHNVVRLLFNDKFQFDFNNRDVWTMFHSYSFDFSVWEMYGSLLYGGKLVMIPKITTKNPQQYLDLLKQENVTILNQTPAAFYNLAYQELTSPGNQLNLRYVIFGGEALNPVKLKKWKVKYPDTKLINMYGITETTVHVTFKELDHRDINLEMSNIGKPIPTLSTYIMDKHLKLTPKGTAGECCVGGEGVGRGYLNQPELTRERFVENPYIPGEKLYRSGDLVKLADNDDMVHLGRIDHQVKIRGFRIELGEIEKRLLQHEAVNEVVVTTRERDRNDKYLCAYIVCKQGFSIPELREYLSGMLPDYMIPFYFVEIEKIPLTSNGKVDHKALPTPQLTSKSGYTAPRDLIEAKLAEIWSDVLFARDSLNADASPHTIRQGGLPLIGIDDDFFELGGHSLKATVLISHVHKELNIKLPLAEVFKTPTIRGLAEYIKTTSGDKYASIKPGEKKEYYVLSSTQKRLYILQQMDLTGTAYNVPQRIPLADEVDIKKLEETFDKLIKRHESLRTSFHMQGGQPIQKVHDEVEFEIQYDETHEIHEKELSEGTKEHAPLSKEPEPPNLQPKADLISSFIRPFDLSQAPLLRIGFFNKGPQYRELFIDMHHIITDGTSHRILTRELMALYWGEELTPPRLHYKDFSEWQNQEKQKKLLKQQELYWAGLFSDELPVLHLPFDYSRPLMQSFEGSSVTVVLTEEETRTLKDIANEVGATLYMSILSVYTILLSKLSGQDDIIVGTPIAARRHADLEKIIGMFVNTLAMRNYPSGNKRFKDFLLEVKARTLENFENQEYQFEDLVDNVSVQRDTSRNPIFDVMFNLQNQTDYTGKIPGIEDQQEYHHQKGTSKFDLNLTAVDMGKRLLLNLEYCTRLFKADTIERIIGYFKNIVSVLSKNRQLVLSDIEIIEEKEKEHLLNLSRGVEEPYNKNITVQWLFEQQADRTPDHIAIVFHHIKPPSAASISYKTLNGKSNQIARILKEMGVGPGTVVGLMVERSIEMIIAMLGILKAGGAYLPIDLEYPLERKKYLLEDSNVKLLLTNNNSEDFAAFIPDGIEVMDLKDENSYRGDDSNPEPVGQGSDLLYVMYTSGSTGNPKGVMLEHCNLVNLIKYQYKYTNIDFSNVLQFTTISFDVSFQEIFSTLIAGGKLLIIEKDVRKNILQLFTVIETNDIKTLFLPASYLRFVLSEENYVDFMPKCVDHIVTAGEQVVITEEFRRYLRLNQVYLHNHYGPTESHVVTTLTLDPRGKLPDLPSIGKPIANTGIYILNEKMHLQVIGVPGELYIAGTAVGRGYWGRDRLTAERFLNNPYRTDEKLYRTGDLARWLSDGNIEFLGRRDHQVKIRGNRVELGEIESQLFGLREVRKTVVLAIEDEKGDKRLCAYIVSYRELSVKELREHLGKRLPDYMVPAYFVFLDKIPLTPNGKVDRRALPAPELTGDEEYIAPRNALEEKLAELWAGVLKVEKHIISIDSDFFELGGHSLKATILTARIYKELHMKVPLAELFKTPTIRGLSHYIKESPAVNYTHIESIGKKECYAVTSSQKRLYILQQMELTSTAYNMPEFIPLAGKPDRLNLEETFKKLINRHESLRTSFHMVGDRLVQKVHDEVEFNIEYYENHQIHQKELSEGTIRLAPLHVEPATRNPQPATSTTKNFIRPFDLSQPPLLRVGLIKLPHTPTALRGHPRCSTYSSQEGMEDTYLLLIDMHHIISDGVSHGILVKDFMAYYDGEELPPLRVQYKDFSQWQNSEPQQDKIKHQEKYWLEEFAGEIPVLELPNDYPRPAIQSFAGSSTRFEISAAEVGMLKKIALSEGSTMFMILLAIFNILLSKLSNYEDIIVGTPIAGRPHADLEKMMGMFVNTLALRNYPVGEQTFREFLNRVKQRTLDAFENQEYPFEDLVEKTSVNRDTGRNPLFDVMFVLQNFAADSGEVKTSGLENEISTPSEEKYGYKKGISKFDLSLIAVEQGGRIGFLVEYCTKLFSRESIERFIDYFKKIVSSVISSPGRKIWEIDIISDEEKEQLLYQFNHTEVQYPTDKTLHQLFEEHAASSPAKIALIFQDSQLTYNELNEKSNILARLLRKMGVKPGNIVGILLDRSLEMIVSILAILKSGGAYVPLDTQYPVERIKYILEDSEAGIVLSRRDLPNKLKFSEGKDVIILNVDDLYQGEILSPGMFNRSNDVAYIIYTSGSTGVPRGVIIEHSSAVNLVFCQRRRFRISEKERILLFSSISFDASVEQIFISLSSGAGLVLMGKEDLLDEKTFEAFVSRFCITHIHAVPSFLKTISLKNRYELKRVIAGGDICPISLAREWYHVCDFYNEYGPTETTVTSTEILVEHLDSSMFQLPIGKPLDNTTVYILDRWEKPVAINVGGELYIGGKGVGRGYLNHVEVTAKKFKINPFSKQGRFYQTGDLARWLPDGNIEFLGRIDHQVKIRGYRIELGEIENRLLKHPRVKEAIAGVGEDNSEDKYLCGYIVPDGNLNIAELREHLAKELPGYVIPSYFVVLEALPLTPNGKVDRKALPKPERTTGAYIAPQDEVEEKLVNVWSEVLGLEKEKISIDANFFALGGHSLKATIMVTKISREFNTIVPLVEIFNTPNIRTLAQYIKNKTRKIEKPIDKSRNLVLLKQASNKNTHLFFIHDGSGEIEGYTEFCNLLDNQLNCWGIRADRMKTIAPRNLTIEKVATNYIKRIKTLQSHGPYFVVGWSIGGTIAFEMIRQLEKEKKEIGFFAMIDAALPQDDLLKNSLPGTFNLQSELTWVRRYLQDDQLMEKLKKTTGIKQFWLLIIEYLQASGFDIEIIKKIINQYEAHVVPNYHQLEITQLINYLNTGRTFRNARALYTPRGKIHTPVHYFAASQSKRIKKEIWNDYCHQPVTFHEITGDHFSILKKPHVIEFARVFSRIIDSAELGKKLSIKKDIKID